MQLYDPDFQGPARSQPRLSVIVPQALHDPRRQFEFLRAWATQQDVDPKSYEVVVAVSDRVPGAADQVREALRPDDRVVVARGKNEAHYYELAIQQARGQLLLLTEDHVQPTSDCVAEVLRVFESSSVDAAFLASDHVCASRFAELEGEYFEHQLKVSWLQPDCWDRIRLRGSVVRRDVLEQVGGFPWEYNLFAERLLAFRLHEAGRRVEFLERAVVHHVNTSRPAELQHDVKLYVGGECRYHLQPNSSRQERELGVPHLVRRHRAWSGGVASMLWLAATRSLLSGFFKRPGLKTWRMAKPLGREVADWTHSALLGGRAHLGWLAAQLAWKRLQLHLHRHHPTKAITAFQHLWEAMAEYERARWLIANPASLVPVDATAPIRLAECAHSQLIGFHAPEVYRGRSFRWSEPVAIIPLGCGPGPSEICIDSGGIRGSLHGVHYALYVNHRRVPANSIDVDGHGRIRFATPRGALTDRPVQWLTLVIEPLAPAQLSPLESRRLGLPVFSIEVRQLSDTITLGNSTARKSVARESLRHESPKRAA